MQIIAKGQKILKSKKEKQNLQTQREMNVCM